MVCIPINVADVNTALLDICRELENRAAHQHVHMLADDIASIQSQLPAVGIWIWRSGAARSQSGLVPWNVQLQNSAPQCFLWEVDAAEIVTSVSLWSRDETLLDVTNSDACWLITYYLSCTNPV